MKYFIMLLAALSALKAQNAEVLSESAVQSAMTGNCHGHFDTLLGDFGTVFVGIEGIRRPSIMTLMPDCFIAHKVDVARRQHKQYVPDESDQQEMLTINAYGVGWSRISGCKSITRVILLSDSTGRITKEAYESVPLEATWHDSLGAAIACPDVQVRFKLSDVAQVQAAAERGEFLVAVYTGTNLSKTYKVKQKVLVKLGLR